MWNDSQNRTKFPADLVFYVLPKDCKIFKNYDNSRRLQAAPKKKFKSFKTAVTFLLLPESIIGI